MTTPRPLADSEKLPVQKHRNAETSKSPEKEDVPLVEKKSKKPKKKEKKHKEKEREKKKKEVEKVRGQAYLSYQMGWGRDVLGCQPPLSHGVRVLHVEGRFGRATTHRVCYFTPEQHGFAWMCGPSRCLDPWQESRTHHWLPAHSGRMGHSVLCLSGQPCLLRARPAAPAQGLCSCGFRVRTWTSGCLLRRLLPHQPW